MVQFGLLVMKTLNRNVGPIRTRKNSLSKRSYNPKVIGKMKLRATVAKLE